MFGLAYASLFLWAYIFPSATALVLLLAAMTMVLLWHETVMRLWWALAVYVGLIFVLEYFWAIRDSPLFEAVRRWGRGKWCGRQNFTVLIFSPISSKEPDALDFDKGRNHSRKAIYLLVKAAFMMVITFVLASSNFFLVFCWISQAVLITHPPFSNPNSFATKSASSASTKCRISLASTAIGESADSRRRLYIYSRHRRLQTFRRRCRTCAAPASTHKRPHSLKHPLSHLVGR